jgi:hypothetical protein
MSAAPAGGKLTIQRIGRDGQGVCAAPIAGAASGATDERTEKRRRESMKPADPSKTMKASMPIATCVPGNSKENW